MAQLEPVMRREMEKEIEFINRIVGNHIMVN